MLDSLSGFVSSYGRPSASLDLLASQRTSVQNILAEYKAENLSKDDAQAIRAAFRAEGIRPSAELKSVIEASGFDVSALKPRSGPHGAGGDPPPPPPFDDEENVIATLLDILEDYENKTLDETALSQIQEKLQEAGYSPRQSYVDLVV